MTYAHSAKMQHADKDELFAQRGSRGGINGESRGALYATMYKVKGKATKQTERQKKRQDQDTQICKPKTTNAIKDNDTRSAKKKQNQRNNTAKRIVMSNLLNISSQKRRKKGNETTNKRVKRAHAIGRNLQKQNTRN